MQTTHHCPHPPHLYMLQWYFHVSHMCSTTFFHVGAYPHPCLTQLLFLFKSFDFGGHHWWVNLPHLLLNPSLCNVPMLGFFSLGKEDYWLQTINFEQSIGKDQGFMWGGQSYNTIKICIVPILSLRLVFIWGKPLNNILIRTGSPDKPHPALELKIYWDLVSEWYNSQHVHCRCH